MTFLPGILGWIGSGTEIKQDIYCRLAWKFVSSDVKQVQRTQYPNVPKVSNCAIQADKVKLENHYWDHQLLNQLKTWRAHIKLSREQVKRL